MLLSGASLSSSGQQEELSNIRVELMNMHVCIYVRMCVCICRHVCGHLLWRHLSAWKSASLLVSYLALSIYRDIVLRVFYIRYTKCRIASSERTYICSEGWSSRGVIFAQIRCLWNCFHELKMESAKDNCGGQSSVSAAVDWDRYTNADYPIVETGDQNSEYRTKITDYGIRWRLTSPINM